MEECVTILLPMCCLSLSLLPMHAIAEAGIAPISLAPIDAGHYYLAAVITQNGAHALST